MVLRALSRNLACKNSLSYIACYAKAGANYVYLQRGYRNYGQPQVPLPLLSQNCSIT